MSNCKYCGRTAGIFSDQHEECQEAFVGALASIKEMARDAALNPSLLDRLPGRIRNTADRGHAPLSEDLFSKVLANSWCEAIAGVVEGMKFSTENQYALNQYRKRFDLTADDLPDAYFEVFRMMTMLRSLLEDGVVPRFDRNAEHDRNGRIPFNLRRNEELIWAFRDVSYLKIVTLLKERLFRSNQYVRSMDHTDIGTLGITTRHIYFAGFTEIFRVSFDDIISTKRYNDGFGIMREAEGASPEAFTMEMPDSWFAIRFIDTILDMDDIVRPKSDSPTLEDIMENDDNLGERADAEALI